jgi:aspartate/methionine/tyrosine aminotransferase
VRFARRLDEVPPYLFAEIERRIDALRAEGVDVISLGIGDPDLPTPPAVVEALREAAGRPETHQYPSNRGLAVFREAVAAFYAERFGVRVDPATEVIPVLGGKEGVAHVALACLDPGDVCLSPDPGYPPYTSGPVFAGAEVVYLPLREENAFVPDLESVPADVAARANSSSTTPTTPPAPSLRRASSSARSPSRASTTSSPSTTPPTPRSPSTATARPASWPRPARWTWGRRSSPSPRAGT